MIQIMKLRVKLNIKRVNPIYVGIGIAFIALKNLSIHLSKIQCNKCEKWWAKAVLREKDHLLVIYFK